MTQPPTPPRRPTFVGTGGRDPRQPFGTPSPGATPLPGPDTEVAPAPSPWATDAHGNPRPPRRSGPLVVTIVVLLLVALGAWAANRWLPDPTDAQATPSTPPAPTAPATPGQVSTGLKSQVPFTNANDQSQGTFAITRHEWTSQGLVLHVRVHLDEGQQKMLFFCLDNASAHDFNPSPTVPGQLDGQYISAGQTLEGTVVFDKPRGDTTVFLAGSDGRQVAALVVTG